MNSNILNKNSSIVTPQGDRLYTKLQSKKKLNIDVKKINFVMLHDLASYHKSFEKLGSSLLKAKDFNADILYMDFRGHGMSSGVKGYIRRINDLTLDLENLIHENLSDPSPEIKKVVIGKGLGALIAIDFLLKTRLNKIVDGLILINPMFSIDHFAPRNSLPILSSVKEFLPLFKLKSPKAKSSFNANLIEKSSDPLYLREISADLLEQVEDLASSLKTEGYFINIPTLLLISEGSGAINHSVVELFSNSIDKKYRSVIKYNHSDIDILNLSNADTIYEDIKKWLKICII